MTLIALAILALFAYAALFFLFGPRIIMRKNTRFGKLKAIRQSLQTKEIHLSRLNDPIEIQSLCNTELMAVTDKATAARVNFKHRNIGDIVDIVHFRDAALRRTMRELRVYAFIVLLLGGLGFLKYLEEHQFSIGYVDFVSWVDRNPFELVAAFEGLVLFALTVRLLVEARVVKELIDGA